MRRAVVAIAVIGCGGGKPPPLAKPAEPPARVTRVPIEDEEPEEGVQIINARGRMERSAIEAGIAPHTESLFDCYTSRVGMRRWLGGHVAIHWEISKTGEVTAVKLAESDLGAWQVEKCLLEVARTATFDKPIGGDADFSIPLDFKPTGRSSTWDEDQAIRAVGGQLALLDHCATNRNGASKMKDKGKDRPIAKTKIRPPEDVVITVYVGPQGKAQSVGFSSATSVLVDEWADCAEKTAMAWRLPDPRGTVAKLAVRYRAN